MDPGDILIDGGNSYYRDDIVRAQQLSAKGIGYVDAVSYTHLHSAAICGGSSSIWRASQLKPARLIATHWLALPTQVAITCSASIGEQLDAVE